MLTDSKTFLAVLLIALTPAVCMAADGDLDLTFGVGGKVTTDIGLGSGADVASDVIACQADGKIVIVGTSRDGLGENITVARYHPDGSLDTTFGSDGTVITNLGSNSRANGVAIQADGRIVVVGQITIPPLGAFFVVLRYLSDGSLDPSFGSGGVVQPNIGLSSETANDVAIQPDGKIVVVGQAVPGITSVDFVLARLLPNGSLDTSFGVGGVVTTDFSTRADTAEAVSIQADGKIVVAGDTISGTSTIVDFAVARYNADGSLDPSFGVGGLVTTDFGTAGAVDQARDVAIQSDGKLVVAGTVFTSASGSSNALARYNPDGSLDTAFGNFGGGGLYLGLISSANSVAIQPDGRIISAGRIGNVTADFAMERLNPDGSRDLSFGSSGRVITNFEPGPHSFFGSVAQGVEILSDGRIILGGGVRLGVFAPTGRDFALARYLPDGTLDVTFGIDGLVTTDFLQETHDFVLDAIAIQLDGKIVVVGRANSGVGTDFAVVRYAADGSLDLTFGDGGVVITDINLSESPFAVALQPDSKIVVVGVTVREFGVGRFDFILARYNSDGSLDGTFGTGGIVTTHFGSFRNDFAFAVVIQSDGKLVVAGQTLNPSEFALARYNPDGTLDVTFGSDGLVTTGFGPTVFDTGSASDLAIQADGKYVVTGFGGSFAGRINRLARYNPDGSLDASFGSGGLVTSVCPGSNFTRVVVLDDGKILTIGPVMARYNADGSPDTSFGNGGCTVTGLSGFAGLRPGAALQPDGKILVAGSIQISPATGADFALARFNPDGSSDTSFGTNGRVTTDFEFGRDGASALALHGGTGVVVGGFAEIGDPPGFDFALVRYQLDLVTNEPPTAVAGSDQSIHAGDLVSLDGSASFDDNTETASLLFAWSFTERPAGSAASLTGAGTATPSFVADLPGTYRLQLVVTDEDGLSSEPDEIVVSSANLAPTADAGDDAGGVVGFSSVLDGSGSSDPEDDLLAFSWSLVQTPTGSTATLTGEGTDMPSLVPDLPGIYVVQLVVSDSFDDSTPDTVTITVVTGEDFAENTLLDCLGLVANLPPDHVTTKGNQRALTNFISQAIRAIQEGDIERALRKIDFALERTDGCVLRGEPDGNGPGRDWITDCVDQVLVYACLILAKESLSL